MVAERITFGETFLLERSREAVAHDFGDDPEDLRPRLVAAATVAAFWSLGDAFKDDVTPALRDDPLAVVDQALTFLRGGIDALRDA